MKLHRIAVAAAAALLALAGCSAAPAVSSPAPSPSGSHAAPAPEPSRPALDELVIETGGLGPLRIGQPVPDEPEGLRIARFDAEVCGTDEFAMPGFWVADYPPITDGLYQRDTAFTASTDGRFGSDASAGGIDVISIGSPEIRTDSGIHIGSSFAELVAAYPGGFDSSSPETPYGMAIAGDDGTIVFNVDAADLEPADPALADTVVVAIWIMNAGTAAFDSRRSDSFPGCA